jgi:hypothetical protein
MTYSVAVASAPVSPLAGVKQSTHLDPYLPIEEVAQRLDLPLPILLRRAEAGDIPVRRVEGPSGPTFTLRLSDLGVEPDAGAETGVATAKAPESEPPSVTIVGSARQWSTTPEPDDAVAQLVPAIERPDSRFPSDPHQEVAAMTLDPRELVAGLLDRWERTLEQRIYAEQRQRFEAELNARQNLVKQLQLELQTVRAENTAAMADRDRRLADAQRTIGQLQQELTETRAAASKRRGLFSRR